VTVFALIGAGALFILYGWLLAAIASSYLSERKGYGEKPGLAAGLFLYPLGVIMWLVWPARPDSKWKQLGPFGRGRSDRERAAPASADDER
jgi:hypothetical protein